MKIDLVAGTRPNVMKVAPLYQTLKTLAWCEPRLVFLKQHEHRNMSHDLLQEFGITDFEVLKLSSTSFGDRLGQIVSSYSDLLERSRPDATLVPGDVDVAVGAALAAKRAQIPVIHLEAGLRSHDRAMPEEINRIIIDAISDLLLTPSEEATQNLIFHEGHPPTSVQFVGNIMIDSLVQVVSDDRRDAVLKRFDVTPGAYAACTFHRPSNVDSPETLGAICDILIELAADRRVIFPVHPRTRRVLDDNGLTARLEAAGLILCEPLGYTEFVNLISGAAFVLTDSGGIQEETSYLGVPCFTLRGSTERPITLTLGTNHLVDMDTVLPILKHRMAETGRAGSHIPLWDGQTAWRTAHAIRSWWQAKA